MREEDRCQSCGGTGSLHRLEVQIHGQNVSVYLCHQCLRERSGGEDLPPQVSVPEKYCANCGTRAEDLGRNFLLGCPECYTVFSSRIISRLREKGCSLGYSGPMPQRFTLEQEARRWQEEMQQQLQEAVLRENYEEAARIRDLLGKGPGPEGKEPNHGP